MRLSERRMVLLVGDLLMLSLALLASLWLRLSVITGAGQLPFTRIQVLWWLVLWALWIPLATIMRCYDLQRAAETARSAIYAAGCAGGVSLIYLVIPVVSAPLTRSRLAWFIFSVLAIQGVAAWRVAYAKLFWQPTFTRRALVVGAGGSGRALAQAIDALGEAPGIQLLGFLDDNPDLWEQEIVGRNVLGPSDQLVVLAEQLRVNDVVVAITDPHRIRQPLLDSLVRCWERGVKVVPMPLFYEEVTGAVPVGHIGQNLFALADSHNATLQPLWIAVRRLSDVAVAVAGLLMLALVFPFIALAIWLDSPGPVFYRQERVGRGGQAFWLTKFRSMIPNAECNGAVWAEEHDDRITSVGRFLRRTRLDELPQLWNLLIGDMTLVGPRPERPEFVQQLDQVLPYYALRHSVKPGLTGWAQVRQGYSSSVDDALTKLEYDLYYVKHRGPVLDAIILLHTVRVVLQMQGT